MKNQRSKISEALRPILVPWLFVAASFKALEHFFGDTSKTSSTHKTRSAALLDTRGQRSSFLKAFVRSAPDTFTLLWLICAHTFVLSRLISATLSAFHDFSKFLSSSQCQNLVMFALFELVNPDSIVSHRIVLGKLCRILLVLMACSLHVCPKSHQTQEVFTGIKR